MLVVKKLLANPGDVRDSDLIPGLKRSPGEGNTQSSILAWRIPWTEGPGGLRFIGSLQRVRHDWSDLAHMHRYWGFPAWVFNQLSRDFSGTETHCPRPKQCGNPFAHHQHKEKVLKMWKAVSKEGNSNEKGKERFPKSGKWYEKKRRRRLSFYFHYSRPKAEILRAVEWGSSWEFHV